jgi:hypothetical protein
MARRGLFASLPVTVTGCKLLHAAACMMMLAAGKCGYSSCFLACLLSLSLSSHNSLLPSELKDFAVVKRSDLN